MDWRAILVISAAFPALLDGELLPIRTYTTADGLAADHVDCVVADSRGFLWFCTPEGLSRFDGYRFVNYGIDEGLPHRAIFSILETRSGVHWIGTPGGLSRINPEGQGGPFTTFAFGRDVRDVAPIWESRSGKILCAFAGGLLEWTGPGNYQRREFLANKQDNITDIVEGPHGDLLVGATTGIYVLKGDDLQRRCWKMGG